MNGILDVMTAIRKAIFTLLSFLMVFGGLLGVPGEAFADQGANWQCNTAITANGSKPQDINNQNIDGGFFIGENIPDYATSDGLDPEVSSFKLICDADGNFSAIEYIARELELTQGGTLVYTFRHEYNEFGSRKTGAPVQTSRNLETPGSTIANAVGGAVGESFNNLGTKVKAFAQDALGYVLAGIAVLITWVNHTVVGLAGALFEVTLAELVGNLGEYIGGESETGKSIEQAWLLFKSLANLVFIFLILFVAIKIILRGNGFGDKRLLGGIVVIALFMNFSLLFTKTFINVSNALSISIYNAITHGDTTSTRKSIGVTLVSHLKLTTFSNSDLPKQMADIGDNFTSNSLQFIMALFATPLFWITALGLTFTAVMLIARMISFIFLMILSPVAFVAAILPGTKGFWQKWLNRLVSNSLSLPVLLVFLYLTLILAGGLSASFDNSGAVFSDLYKVLGNVFTTASADQVMAEAAEAIVGVMKLLINYSIIMASLFFAFWGSRKIGISGASWATAAADTKTKMIKYGLRPAQGGARAAGRGAAQTGRVAGGTVLKAGGAATGLLGRNTLGKGGDAIAKSDAARNLAARKGIMGLLGRGMQGGGNRLASASYGGSEGGLEGRRKMASAEAERLLALRQSLGEFSSKKEQKVKNKYDQSRALQKNAIQKRKAIENELKDSQKEEIEMIQDLVTSGVANASQKTSYDNADREVKTLEKKKRKDGALSATDEANLARAKKNLTTAKDVIFRSANSSSTVSNAVKTNITNVQQQIKDLAAKIPDAKIVEIDAKAEFNNAQKEFKDVEKEVKARVQKFDDDVSNKTLSITGKLLQSSVVKATAGVGIGALGVVGMATAAVPTAAAAGVAGARYASQDYQRQGRGQYTARVASGNTKPVAGGSKPGGSSSTT